MRQRFGCLTDPYVHVILIGLALAWLATAGGPGSARVPGLIHCKTCGDYHEPDEARCLVVGTLQKLSGGWQ